MLSESANNAEAMADAYGVPVPNIKKQLIAFSIVTVLVLIAIYIPQYVQGSQETQEKIALAAEQIDMAENALEQVCERVSADDPYEKYKDYGYHVRGYLREGDYSWEGAYVYLTFDEYGTITEINYCEGVNVAASLEENLSQAERDFQTLNAPLNGLNISVADPELLATSAIPVDFKETFLAGRSTRVSAYTATTPSFASPAPSIPNQRRNSTNTRGRRSRSRYGKRIRSGIIGKGMDDDFAAAWNPDIAERDKPLQLDR